MFERRLKILLILPIVCGLVVLGRLFQLQIVSGSDYARQAEEALISPKQYLPPLRGRILDRFGRVLVSDEPAHDITLHYGVLSMNQSYLLRLTDYVRKQELKWRSASDAEIEDEVERRIAGMWTKLSEVSGLSLTELRRRRDAICETVESLRRHIWKARRRVNPGETLERLRLQEEELFHPFLTDVSPAVRTRIELEMTNLPCLRIEPSVRRVWSRDAQPLCHLLGRLGQVTLQAIDDDPWRDDELGGYRAGDERGVSGVEALGERMLRGKRGYEEKYRDGLLREHVAPIDGLDVQLTIDFDLQAQIAQILAEAVKESPPSTGASCVVIDVATREVLALVSVPTFHRDDLRSKFETLRDDAKHLPLFFRAVQGEYQPGSIIKPVALLAGFARGVVDAVRTVFCDGTFIPGSKRWHCWTYWRSMPGHGTIKAEEAIQHSCNIYFFDLGQRLDAEILTDFYRGFIQGREPSDIPQALSPYDATPGTGLIEERQGLIPSLAWMKTQRQRGFRPADGRNYAIGQGEILVTPLQAANSFATIASGCYRSPTVIANDMRDRATLPVQGVSAEAWQITRRGLYRCVNEEGGTAYAFARMDQLEVCGKTGSAQCAQRVVQRRYFFRAEKGNLGEVTTIAPTIEAAWEMLGLPVGTKPLRTEVIERYPPVDPETGKSPTHAWFAGYAPYRHPRVAVAVLIEYGGSGGRTAGPAAKRVFESLLHSPRGYLSADNTKGPGTSHEMLPR